ncbi:MAG: DsbA family oxidoreductase [Alphaproteobacteria bacterium]
MIIEIYSDTICPWCFIGMRRFARARAMRPDIPFEIKWRTFQLNPWMPVEGMGRQEYLTAKFGSSDAGRVYDNIRRVGQGEGIDFAFDQIDRMPNTVESHRLVRWAGREDPTYGETAVVEALFDAHFLDARDLGAADVLADIAGEAGFEYTAAKAYLESDEDREDIRAEDATARQMGIQGVPCFIVDGSYAVSGAQEPEYFMPLFDLAGSAAPE